MIISLEQAIAQKSSPSELRVLANCLDRIARDGYEYVDENTWGEVGPMYIREPAYDYRVCQENAAALRRLAGQLQRRK